LDEKRLIRRLKQRDDAAFGRMVLQFQGPVFNLCLRMLSNPTEAEDVAQDVFVKCFLAIESFRGDSSLGTWLYRIAVNLCKNRLKYLGRRRYNATDRFEDLPDGAVSRGGQGRSTLGDAPPRPDLAFEGSQAERRVQRALAAVDDEYRALLVLRDVQGFSYAEVVTITGLPEGTVKSRLHRARAMFRKVYDDLEGGG